MPYERITILGCGLIGGSLALGLKAEGFRGEVVAHDRPEALEAAQRRGAIDRAETELTEAVNGADVIVVSTPVLAILDLLSRLAGCLSAGALVTDTGSTKVRVCRHAAKTLPPGVAFLGGHPMAGGEAGGIENARADLFQGWKYVLVRERAPETSDSKEKIAEFLAWIKKLGAEPVWMSADAHDRAVAWISHLPQLLSTGLASVVAEETGPDRLPAALAGKGFRDMVRLGGSPYGIWRDICLTNGENLRQALSRMEQKLAHLRERLGERDLAGEFDKAQRLVKEFRLGRKSDG